MTDLRNQIADFEAVAERATVHRCPRPIPLHRESLVGPLLRELRHRAGLSLRQLAPLAHVSKAGLSKREQRGGLTVGALVDHARVLGYDLALLPREDA